MCKCCSALRIVAASTGPANRDSIPRKRDGYPRAAEFAFSGPQSVREVTPLVGHKGHAGRDRVGRYQQSRWSFSESRAAQKQMEALTERNRAAKKRTKPVARKPAAKPPAKKKTDTRTRRFLDALLGLKL